MTDADRDRSVQTLDRGLALLEIVAAHQPVSVGDVAAHAGLHKSTVSRLLAALRAGGWVVQGAETTYTLGTRALSLAARAADQPDLTAVARPDLERLQREFGETVHLGVLTEGRILCVDRVESGAFALRVVVRVGTWLPAHSTAMGKAILATMDEAAAWELLAVTGLTAVTPATITDEVALRKELDGVRASGFAIDNGESGDGIRCVGAAIVDGEGRPFAAVSVAGAAARLPAARCEAAGRAVMEVAANVSRRMGCPLDRLPTPGATTR